MRLHGDHRTAAVHFFGKCRHQKYVANGGCVIGWWMVKPDQITMRARDDDGSQFRSPDCVVHGLSYKVIPLRAASKRHEVTSAARVAKKGTW